MMVHVFQVVVNALFAAIPGIANVLLVSLLFWLIFSILGVQLFAGMFFKCLDDDGNRLPFSEINNMTQCLGKGYRWENSNVNFDNVINGFLALFQVVSYIQTHYLVFLFCTIVIIYNNNNNGSSYIAHFTNVPMRFTYSGGLFRAAYYCHWQPSSLQS
jgi:hypothetical protein